MAYLCDRGNLLLFVSFRFFFSLKNYENSTCSRFPDQLSFSCNYYHTQKTRDSSDDIGNYTIVILNDYS